MVKDIYGGNSSSNPAELINANGKLFFTALNPNTGFADLFRSDGTAEGTQQVQATNNLYSVQGLTEVNGDIFFTADRNVFTNSSTGLELFKTDGTASGTKLVKDIWKGAGGSNPTRLTNVNGTLFFQASSQLGGNELWKSNGTSTGTVQVKDIALGASDSNPNYLVNVGGQLFFTANDSVNGNELWRATELPLVPC